MPNAFGDLRERHAGKTIHVVGCGPSLDRFNMRRLTEHSVAICINDAIAIVPRRCKRYWVFQDVDVARSYANRRPLSCTRMIDTRLLSALAHDHLEVFRKYANDEFVLWRSQTNTPVVTRETAAASWSLYVCQGTVTPAAHLAWFLGAEKVVFVGVDGGVGTSARRANAVRSEEEQLSRKTVDYSLMRTSAERVLRLLSVPFEHAGEEVPCDA